MIRKGLGAFFAVIFLSFSTISLASCKDDKVCDADNSVWQSSETTHWHSCEGSTEKLDEAEHKFSDWKVIESPTCDTDGKKTKSCVVCGYTVEEVIPKTGKHILNDKYESDESYHWKECNSCGSVVEKEKHKEDVFWHVDETSHWHICETCGRPLNKVAHDFGEWKVVSEPTCAEKGYREHQCKVCGFITGEDIPTIDKHILGEISYTKIPTSTEEGIITLICANSYSHRQEVKIPKIDEENYIDVTEGNSCSLVYDYAYKLKDSEANRALFKGTMIEDNLAKLLEIFDHKFITGRHEVEQHELKSISLLRASTFNFSGEAELLCSKCDDNLIVVFPTLNAEDYTFENTADGKVIYKLKLEIAKNLLTYLDENTADAENWNIKSNLVDYATKLSELEMITTPRDLSIEKYILVDEENISLTIKLGDEYKNIDTGVKKDLSNLRIDYKTTGDCSEPVQKLAYLKTNLLDLSIFPFEAVSHPEFQDKLEAVVIEKLAISDEEIAAHIDIASKHVYKSIILQIQPTLYDDGNLVVTCSKNHNINIKVPKLSETDYLINTEGGHTTYTIKEATLNNLITEINKLIKELPADLDQTITQLLTIVI